MDPLSGLLVELLRIPSPSGQEDKIIRFVRDFLCSHGWLVEEDGTGSRLGGRGNLIVRPAREKRRVTYRDPSADNRGAWETAGEGNAAEDMPVLLVAHLDTVPVPYTDTVPLEIEGDVIRTDGTGPLGADDKAGVALALYLLEKAAREPDRYVPLEAVFTVREEQGAKERQAWIFHDLTPPGVFVLMGKLP